MKALAAERTREWPCVRVNEQVRRQSRRALEYLVADIARERSLRARLGNATTDVLFDHVVRGVHRNGCRLGGRHTEIQRLIFSVRPVDIDFFVAVLNVRLVALITSIQTQK